MLSLTLCSIVPDLLIDNRLTKVVGWVHTLVVASMVPELIIDKTMAKSILAGCNHWMQRQWCSLGQVAVRQQKAAAAVAPPPGFDSPPGTSETSESTRPADKSAVAPPPGFEKRSPPGFSRSRPAKGVKVASLFCCPALPSGSKLNQSYSACVPPLSFS